ncbi:hypothetical protein EBZ39_19320 [bacterium]|nr:hypothetical protein [bacterium]
MIVHICIHVPDLAPNGPKAVTVTDKIEAELAPKLHFLTSLYGNGSDWWMDVENGETRYMPENVSELS